MAESPTKSPTKQGPGFFLVQKTDGARAQAPAPPQGPLRPSGHCPVPGPAPALRSAAEPILHGRCWRIQWNRWGSSYLTSFRNLGFPEPIVFMYLQQHNSYVSILTGEQSECSLVPGLCRLPRSALSFPRMSWLLRKARGFSFEQISGATRWDHMGPHGTMPDSICQILRQRLPTKLVWAHTVWAPQSAHFNHLQPSPQFVPEHSLRDSIGRV